MHYVACSRSLVAGSSLESVHVVGASGVGFGGVVLVASLHVLKELSAAGVVKLESVSTEVSLEEVGEGGDGGSTGGVTDNLERVGGSEQVRSVQLELAHVGVEQVAGAEAGVSLEGVAGHVCGMSVV